jgi:hypothetical protein
MSEERKVTGSRWGGVNKKTGQLSHRRDLTEEAAKKAGYPGALREPKGWFRGARVGK